MTDNQLNRGVLARHIVMIALGGTISASFFLGIGGVLHSVGAFGTVLGFVIGSIIVMLVLASLAEMAIAMPISGSFQAYATRFISPYSGFMTGWLYLLNWLTAAVGGLVAAGIICHNFYAPIPIWQYCLVFIIIVSLLNFYPVRIFAEIEFWLAEIKIVTILLFIIIGLAIITGILHVNKPIYGLVNFYGDGLFPNGFRAFLFGLVVIVCTFQGAELVGIAAGETEDPEKNIRKAIKSVAIRMLLFFVLSSFIIAYIVPYKNSSVINTPFVTILQWLKIKHIDTIMQLIILTASLSAINSCFYACSRLLWAMAKTKQAPPLFTRLNRNRIPFFGVLLVAILSSLCLITKFIGAGKVFILIVSSSGMVGSIIWIIISLCHIFFRETLSPNEVKQLKFKMVAFPLIPYLSILFNMFVIIGMLWDPGQRAIFFSGVGLIIFFSILYRVYYKNLSVKNKPVNV